MKKWILTLLIVCVFFIFGATYTVTQTEQTEWQVIDTTTSAGDEPNDLAVGERTYTTVSAAAEGGDEEISIFNVPEGANSARLRVIGATNNQSVTYQIYIGTKAAQWNCDLAKVCQLAFTVGQQASYINGYEYADTVTVTEYCLVKDVGSSSPGSDLVAEVAFDLMGADIIVAVPTTADCNCKLLFKGY